VALQRCSTQAILAGVRPPQAPDFLGSGTYPRLTLFPLLCGDLNAGRDLRQSVDRRQGSRPRDQLRELRAWCINSGHTISHEYVEHESGRKGADRRKQFAALFDDAAKRKFDLVLFWALDRFSREGMAQTIAHLQRLVSYGVAFHSYTEPHLATDNELVRNILLALLSSLAKLEAQKISERTKAGMARAKTNGIKIGRPKLGIEIRQKIMQRAKKGETPYAIAKALGIDRHTAAKYVTAAAN
jgi:DNA invertase Pin-like site-specific DNA recombinase